MEPMVLFDARKTTARRIARHTGMTYTAALRYMDATRHRQPQHRWVLTESVRRFLGGEMWVGLRYRNLYDWLDGLDPVYRCSLCQKEGDARHQDSSICIAVTKYDPDLSPRTWIRRVTKYHSACQESVIVWDEASDVPSTSEELQVHVAGWNAVFSVAAVAVSAPTTGLSSSPLLVIAATAVEMDDGFEDYHGYTWDRELGHDLARQGFSPRNDGTCGALIPVWSIRAELANDHYDRPAWAAIRTAPVRAGTITPTFFFGPVGSLDATWLAQARATGEVEVVVTAKAGAAESMYSARVELDARAWPKPNGVPRHDLDPKEAMDRLVNVVNLLR